jgi:hypothetical protein
VAVQNDAATGSPPPAEWSAEGTKIAPAAAALASSLAPRKRVPQLSRSWPGAFSQVWGVVKDPPTGPETNPDRNQKNSYEKISN